MVLNAWLVEEASRDEFHDAAEDFEKSNRRSDGNEGNNETVWGEEDEVEETVEEWNKEGAYHDGDDGEEEAGTEGV